MPCCAVRRELSGFALIAAMAVLSVAESGFGVHGRPGLVAELLMDRALPSSWTLYIQAA